VSAADGVGPPAGGNPYADPATSMPATLETFTLNRAQQYPLEFTGKAGEYFRIWIVNLALTIVTLGIYSAWAKVRKKRYFYGHTWIDGENFDYHGQPIAILKGRLIAVALLAIYSLAEHISPLLKVGAFVALLFAVPWLVVRSAAFNAYNSAYRNVRLHFDGTYTQALGIVIGYGFLTVITLGLFYPAFRARLARFIASHHLYGTARFSIGPLTRGFYGIFFRASGLLIGGGFLLGAAVAGVFAGAMRGAVPSTFGPSMFGAIAGGYALYLLVYAYVRARTTNLIWNEITVGPASFLCILRARDLAWIYVTNIFSVIVTLGLATPWAVVRTMRYRASKMRVLATGGLERFVAAEAKQVSAAGEAVGEIFDIDFGL
jgi:uncharacterized membrane protein YjgN (DUF898 family)